MNAERAVVTGAASGIGRALATRLAARGSSLLLVDSDGASLAELADELGAQAAATDVSDSEAMEAVAREAADATLVCLNAGVVGSTTGPPWTVPDDEWRRVLDVNLGGVINGLRAFVPRMLQASPDERHVLLTASLAGLITFPTGGAYAASKHAVVAVAEQTALALEGTSVTVTMICPALVKTRMSPTGASPDDVADAALRAIADGIFAQVPSEWHAAVVDRASRLTTGLAPTFPSPS